MSQTPKVVYSGTQVVTAEPILGTNKAVIHPRGAVGVVTRTPCCEDERHYLVRFPDGFEASLTIDQIEVLKHFKDRMTETGDNHAGADFDLESCIILRCVIGSRAYGLDTEESDTDFRGVYLAPSHLQWSLYGAPEQFEDNQTQSCYWEAQKFLVMALKANPNILECLYSPLVDKISPIGEKLLSIRDHFLSQMIFQTFSGYALSQFKKMEQDVRNHGSVKWKHAMHLLRLLMVGTNALRDGTLNIHAGAMRERLLTVKRGELSWEQVTAWRVELQREFEQALVTTKLPERPDYNAANQFLLEARRQAAAVLP